MRDPRKELRLAIETAERRLITPRVVARARAAAEALAVPQERWKAISNFLDSRNVSHMTIPVDRVDARLCALAWEALHLLET